MKKTITIILLVLITLTICGFTMPSQTNEYEFDINDLYNYKRKFVSSEIEVCGISSAKTYMDYRMTTLRSSRQYKFIHSKLTVDKKTGFLYDDEGFIAVALGSYYGEIGDRYYFTLENGTVLPLVKAEEKADVDTDSSGCYHLIDGSIMEFVIDEDYALSYFPHANGLANNGNYNNYSLFSGDIVKVEEVSDEIRDDYITYSKDIILPDDSDMFNYASGY